MSILGSFFRSRMSSCPCSTMVRNNLQMNAQIMSSFTPIVIAAGSPRLVEQMKMNPQFTWLNKVHDQLKYGSECGIMAMVCQHWMSCSRWLSPLSSDSLLMGVRISEKCRWIMEHGKDSETSRHLMSTIVSRRDLWKYSDSFQSHRYVQFKISVYEIILIWE